MTIYSVGSQNIELRLMGTNNEETRILDSLGYKKYHKTFVSLNDELDKTTSKLNTSGYLQHLLLNFKKTNDSLYQATYQLNSRVKLIRVADPDNLIPTKTAKSFSVIEYPAFVDIPVSQLESLLKKINSDMADKGQPFSTLQLTNFKAVNDSVLSASLSTSRSKLRTIDKIVLKGYEAFPKSYIKRNLKLKAGQQFNLTEIQRKSRRLKNIRFAKEIKSPEVLFTNDSTILYIYVEKVKQNIFDGFLGFGTNETSNKLELDGYLNLSLNNNLNYGESFELFYKSDENEQKTFDASLSMPYLFGTPVGVSVHLNIFKRDSSFINTGQHLKLNYQFSSLIEASIGFNTTSSSNLLDITTSQIEDYQSNFYMAGLNYKDRDADNRMFPIKNQLQLITNFGSRSTDDFEDDQIHLILNASTIFNLNDRNSIYTRVTANYLDSENYLENELPRFGGINSIRGFEENSLLANTYGVLNTEYRYLVNSNLYVHSVIDAAYFENELSDQKNKLFGFGFGFGLLTNAGLLKLTYATAKTENQKIQLNDSKVHLSLVAIF